MIAKLSSVNLWQMRHFASVADKAIDPSPNVGTRALFHCRVNQMHLLANFYIPFKRSLKAFTQNKFFSPHVQKIIS